MLELRLCEKGDIGTVARLLVKAHAPSDATSQDVYGWYLERLKANLAFQLFSNEPSRVVVLGVAGDGIVHAAYELPSITRHEGVTDLTLIRGYIAAEPENRGFGSALFQGVTHVLEQLAFDAGEPIVHLPETSFRHTTTFFLRRGYFVIREEDSIPTATYYLKKVILPKSHDIKPSERAIVGALMRISSLEPVSPVVSL